MIPVEPAEPERVLPCFLQTRRAVLSRVIKPLGFEEELARDRLAEIALGPADELERRIEAAGRAVLGARAQTKCFEVAEDELCPRPFADGGRARRSTAIGRALDDPELGFLVGDERAADERARMTFE